MNDWHQQGEHLSDLYSLLRRLLELHSSAFCRDANSHISVTYAFRGLACDEWQLTPTLARKPDIRHDVLGLRYERDLVESFRSKAWRFLMETERRFLWERNTSADDPACNSLDWKSSNIWNVIAIARHYGVPTRLLDWTHSVWIAAYFAAIDKPESNGAVWWFDQHAFEKVLHPQWESFKVPKRDETRDDDHRAMERMSFDIGATEWISKIHHHAQFHRLEVQQGFFTACGRLDLPHDEATKKLDKDNEIPRGRLIIPAKLKKPLLDSLERMGVHAKAIDYPGADIIGCELANEDSQRRTTS